MNELMPPLNLEALQHLREIVRQVGLEPRNGVPLAEVLALPATLAGGMAVTVDFLAARELGREWIILRVPSTASQPRANPCLASLSPRELEIAGLVAAGLSNKQIAARKVITLATVKSHVHQILAKTRLPNRAAIAAAVAGCHTE